MDLYSPKSNDISSSHDRLQKMLTIIAKRNTNSETPNEKRIKLV